METEQGRSIGKLVGCAAGLLLVGVVAGGAVWYFNRPAQFSPFITDNNMSNKIINEMLPSDYIVLLRKSSTQNAGDSSGLAQCTLKLTAIVGHKDNTPSEAGQILPAIQRWAERYVHVDSISVNGKDKQFDESIKYSTRQTMGEMRVTLMPKKTDDSSAVTNAWELELQWTEQRK